MFYNVRVVAPQVRSRSPEETAKFASGRVLRHHLIIGVNLPNIQLTDRPMRVSLVLHSSLVVTVNHSVSPVDLCLPGLRLSRLVNNHLVAPTLSSVRSVCSTAHPSFSSSLVSLVVSRQRGVPAQFARRRRVANGDGTIGPPTSDPRTSTRRLRQTVRNASRGFRRVT